MNIMILTVNSWSDENSLGNTLSNWFSGWDDLQISNIYMREAQPNNRVCRRYFQITDKMLLKNFLTPWRIGREQTIQSFGEKVHADSASVSAEQNMKRKLAKRRTNFLYWCQDIVWNMVPWTNLKLKKFILHEKPDVVFCFGMPCVQYLRLMRFVKKVSDCKGATYISDNVYSEFHQQKSFRDCVNDRRFRKMLELSDQIYGASEELSAAYAEKFGRRIETLIKGASFETPLKNKVNDPIQITYAGNLLFGRLNTILEIIEILDNINRKNGIRFQFDIYTGTDTESTVIKKINSRMGCSFKGQAPYEKIKEYLAKSDIVLHLESFQEENIDSVKFSISTKIMDCLQSGSVMMVIGPRGISSVEYPRKISGAIVVDDLGTMESILQKISEHPENLVDRAVSIRRFAEEHHDIQTVHDNLQRDFQKLISKE